MSFKDHFSGHAAVYREARPGYPDTLFSWLAAQCANKDMAWDAGCGNGQASVALAAHFRRVVATDPSATQIAEAEQHTKIDYRVEPAEHSSLDDASVDLVTVAQALHWFDLARFHAEVHRVLRPHGVAAFWTYADCKITPGIDRCKDRLYVDLTGPYWPPERALVESGYRDLPFPFTRITPPTFAMECFWTAAQFLAYLRSWSGTQRYQKALGHDPVSLIEADLVREWGDPQHKRTVSWALALHVGRKD